jgi:hypothetical protein
MLLPILCLWFMSSGVYGQQADSAGLEKRCKVVRTPVTMDCPSGWTILRENEHEAVVANFRVGPGVTEFTSSGHGKASIAVSNMPTLYRTFSEWIFAAHKNAPDAVEKRISVTAGSGAPVPVVWFTPSDATGPMYASYFFQVGRNPVLVELSYRGDDPKREEYIAAAKAVIASAVAER